MSLPVDPRWVELSVVLATVALAFAFPGALRPAYRRLRRGLDWIARRPTRAVVLTALAAGLGSAVVALCVQWPTPRVHDEFSYLMAADTFAHGRLANPTHAMWRHFESFHVFFTPVYASKYPPAQGLVLAVGQVLFGEPAVGLWISAALSCGALAWMFQAWLAPRWAALAAMLAVVQVGIGSYWTQSYWGGAVAATGGALVFGALPRLVREHRARHAFVLGLGLAILANSRPFEGLAAAAPVAMLLCVHLVRSRGPGRVAAWVSSAAPVALVLAACAAWIAAYDRAITGAASVMPYWIHDRLYTVAPPFLWMSLTAEPHYNHAVMRDYWLGFGLDEYTRQSVPGHIVDTLVSKALVFWRFYVGSLWTLPCLALSWALRTPWIRFAAASVAFFFLALLGSTYTLAHYAAPIACLLLVLIVAGLRRISVLRVRGRAVGRAIVVLLCLASLGSLAGQIALRRRPADAWDQVRARMQAELAASPEPDVVIVRYGPEHSAHDEWVYNVADIDAAPVVWARDMSDADNRALCAYFGGRSAWLLEVDFGTDAPRLTRFAR